MKGQSFAYLILLGLLMSRQVPAGVPQAVPEPPPSASLQDLLSEASRDLTEGRFAQAASHFRSILADHPMAADALFGLGVACSQLGLHDEAQAALRQYIKLRPRAADGYTVLGLSLIASGKWTEAKSVLERALPLDPGSLETAKALAHVEAGDYNGSRVVSLLLPFLHSPEFDAESRLLLATGYAEIGKNQEAASILGLMLDKNPPPPPEAFILAATTSMKAGDRSAAARACALGLREYLNSDEVERCCLDIAGKGALDPFISQLESNLRGTEQDIPDLILLGRLMTDANPEGGAPLRERGLQMLEKAVALNGSDASALYNLGRCLRVLNRFAEAVAILKRALAARPDEELLTLIHTQIGLAEQESQRDSGAEAALRRAFQNNLKAARFLPDAAFAYFTFLQNARKSRESAAVLSEILKRRPDFLPARFHRARAFSEAGQIDKSIQEAEFVVRHLDPDALQLQRAARLFLVRLYTRTGRPKEAAPHLAWLENHK